MMKTKSIFFLLTFPQFNFKIKIVLIKLTYKIGGKYG